MAGLGSCSDYLGRNSDCHRYINGSFTAEPTSQCTVMGITSDPTCNYCEEGLETAAHFICECRHFAALCPEIWGNLIYTFLKLTQYRILWDSSKNHTDFRNTKVLRKSVWFLDVIIGILLGMAFGPTRQSRPTGLYEPCRWLEMEWNQYVVCYSLDIFT